MKKIILVNGLIAGSIVTVLMLFSIYYCTQNGNFENGMIYGYTAMILAFSMIFVGIKTFRDKYLGGSISFGKAFKIGILIALVASTMYVVGWLIDFYFFVPDFAQTYSNHMLEKLKASGASAAEIAKQTQEMVQFQEWYKNPLFVIVMTYIEILPVGLVVTLISALLLKRKNQRPQVA